jgi:glycosyltransferase involved in cell wall biosynthesis
MKPELSVVTPCYNEELTIRECVLRLSGALSESGVQFEHILVNNASVDRTLEVLKGLKDEFPHVRVLDNEFNVGAFRSMQRGITAAQGDLIVPFLAADCQDPPEVIPQMLRIREETKCDTVAGVRKSRHDGVVISLFRRMFYKILLLATRGRYKSGASEFRLMSTASALQLAAVEDSTPFLRVYMAQIQGRVVYLDYEMAERNAGVSSTSFFPLVDDALNGIMLAAPSMFSRALVFFVPLTLASYVATLASLLGSVLDWSTCASLLVPVLSTSAFLTLGSFHLITGHYLYMVHSQVRSGPNARTEEI